MSGAVNMARLCMAVQQQVGATDGVGNTIYLLIVMVSLHQALVAEGVEGVEFVVGYVDYRLIGRHATVAAIALNGKLWSTNGQTTQREMKEKLVLGLAKDHMKNTRLQFAQGEPPHDLLLNVPDDLLMVLRQCVREEQSCAQAHLLEDHTDNTRSAKAGRRL